MDIIYQGAFEKGSYSYSYAGGQKKIDFRKGTWLIASYDEYEIQFFEQFLGNRLTPLNQVRNDEGKLVFNFDDDITDNELALIKTATDYDYLITLSHSEDNKNRVFTNNKTFTKEPTYTNERQTSMISVYDIGSGFLEYQIVCTGTSESDDDRLFELNTKYSLLKKIKRKAKK